MMLIVETYSLHVIIAKLAYLHIFVSYLCLTASTLNQSVALWVISWLSVFIGLQCLFPAQEKMHVVMSNIKLGIPAFF